MRESLILILGLPRSGTSWLGKVFDSHPDVAYLHEPDKHVLIWDFGRTRTTTDGRRGHGLVLRP
jgi:hypothetical protein